MIRYFVLAVLLIATSCNVRERPISYGTDECDFCKMTIMDHRYGSELVTIKGKIYVFDSAECLIDFHSSTDDVAGDTKHLLVTAFTDPDHLFDATRATYLVSRNLPSPMGAYLTAFSDSDSANVYLQNKGGRLYDWEALIADFRAIKTGVIEGHE